MLTQDALGIGVEMLFVSFYEQKALQRKARPEGERPTLSKPGFI